MCMMCHVGGVNWVCANVWQRRQCLQCPWPSERGSKCHCSHASSPVPVPGDRDVAEQARHSRQCCVVCCAATPFHGGEPADKAALRGQRTVSMVARCLGQATHRSCTSCVAAEAAASSEEGGSVKKGVMASLSLPWMSVRRSGGVSACG